MKQALLAFLGNAAGAAGSKVVGAGANALGQFTPEEALAREHMAETARHNMAGETLGGGELAMRNRASEAEIENMRNSFGLKREQLGLEAELGRGRLAGEQAGQVETGRHNLATEGEATRRTTADEMLVGAQAKHLGSQSKQLDAGTNMQTHVQRQMALQEVLKGVDPKSSQAMFLTQAANDVPFDGDMQKFAQTVHAHAQEMARAQVAGGAVTPDQVGPSMAERGGMLQVASDALNPIDQATQFATDPQNLMRLAKLKEFLLGRDTPIVPMPTGGATP